MVRKSGRVDWDNLPHGGDLFGELQLADSAAATVKRPPLFPGPMAQ